MSTDSGQSVAGPSQSIQVSLAGATPSKYGDSPGSTVSSTLDDALSKLSSVTVSPSPKSETGTLSPYQLNRVLSRIEAMAAARSRREAIEQLVDLLARQAGDATVRCGFGRSRMHLLRDGKLGWIESASPLFAEHARRWQHDRFNGDVVTQDTLGHESASVQRYENSLQLHLPQSDGMGRCIVWIESDTPLESRFTWLSQFASTLAVVLWSRPALSWPSLLIQLARQSYLPFAVAAVLFALLMVWPVPYRIGCTAKVETTHQRLISAPFEATLLKTNVVPGDTVSRGEILFELDGRPLRLERESLTAEIQQVAKEEHVARANGRIAEAQQAALKKQQLERKYDLLTDRLSRLEVVSPIDGVVVSGELQKHVGSPLERGQSLIEVAPMDRMIIEVEIPEHEIGYVEENAETRVKLDAIGGRSIEATLGRINPAAEVREDRNVFVARVEINNEELQLKPGMRGKATTYGPLRPWIWSWVRTALERMLWWIGY